jgi:glycosyltransferase involved in cell wall biosynthesis
MKIYGEKPGNKNFKISIIIPAFNVELYIERCIESLINQTYCYIEIIIINDGSNDNTYSVLENIRSKHSDIKIIHQINQGQGSARNRGLEEATGEFIMFVDADDVLDFQCCEKSAAYMQATNADFACFGVKFSREDGEIERILKFPKYTLIVNNFIKNYLQRGNILNVVWNKIYKKKFLDLSNIRFDNNRVNEDALFTLKLVCNTKSIGMIPYVLYDHRSDNINSYSNKIEIGHLLSTANVIEKQELYLKNMRLLKNFRSEFSIYALKMISHLGVLGGVSLQSGVDIQSYYLVFKNIVTNYNKRKLKLFVNSPVIFFKVQALIFKPIFLIVITILKFKK